MEGHQSQHPPGCKCRTCGRASVIDAGGGQSGAGDLRIDLRAAEPVIDLFSRDDSGPDRAIGGNADTRTGAAATSGGTTARVPGLVAQMRQVGVVWVVLAVLACTPVAAWWVEWAVSMPANGVLEGATDFRVADDFGVFYTAGSLIGAGQPEVLYDVGAFGDQLTQSTGFATLSNTAFANSPAFALVMAPFSAVSWQLGWLVWTALGLVALGSGIRFLGVQRAVRGAGIVLLTFPAYLAINSGQSTFFWFCIIAGVFVLLKRGSTVHAGLLAGLLILKPPLVIGFGLWWLIDRRMHRTLLAAAVSGVSIVVISAPLVGQAWLEYPAAILRFSDMHASSAAQVTQFSTWGFLDLLFPGHHTAATVVGVVASIVGVAAFVVFFGRHRDEWPLLFAASVFAMLWISPHVLPYDWVLLAVPLIVLWRERPESVDSWLRAAIVLAFVALWSLPLNDVVGRNSGRAAQIAVPMLGLVVWFIARVLRTPQPIEPILAPTERIRT